MGFWGSINNSAGISLLSINEVAKPTNFDKYNKEIEKTKQYIKAKREAFYKNNNLKEK